MTTEFSKPVGTNDTRSSQADLMRAKRTSERIVTIPKCVDPERRALLETDDIEWLGWYFGPGCGLEETFTYKFTNQQQQMIGAIREAIVYSWSQAIAASRGDGKSTLSERMLIKTSLTGEVNYAVLFAATAGMACDRLDSIKNAIEWNERLAADYPEVCIPVRALEGVPQRAHGQLCNGFRHDTAEPFETASTQFTWCGDEITFPRVPGSPSASAIIATRGLDSAVRGLNKRGRRPQLGIIDDPDTTDTQNSEEQAGKLLKNIDHAIGGLGSQSRGMGRLALMTIPSRTSVAYLLMQKPAWRPVLFRYLVKSPDRVDLWEEYIAIRRSELSEKDAKGDLINPHARKSHAFLLDRRDEMHRGAEVGNVNRFDSTILPDGSQVEVSALEAYYNLKADRSEGYCECELDNDPPDITGVGTSALTKNAILKKLSGFDCGVIPDDCVALSQGIDVGMTWLHWVVRAWKLDGTGYTIDYGRYTVHEKRDAGDEGLDESVRAAILERLADSKNAYHKADGQTFNMLTLVDARYRTDAVKKACLEVGLGIYPVMGMGHSFGCVGPWRSRTANQLVKVGDNWQIVAVKLVRIVEAYADHWKSWEHDRWMTSSDKPGSMSIFGITSDPNILSREQWQHTIYAEQVCAEVEIEEPFKGGLRRSWKKKSNQNHYLDASYYSCVAASMLNIRLAGPHTVKPVTSLPSVQRGGSGASPAKPPAAQELAGKAKHYSAIRR